VIEACAMMASLLRVRSGMPPGARLTKTCQAAPFPSPSCPRSPIIISSGFD